MPSDALPWSRRLEPVEDELLSSFLVRAAVAHHADPYRFCRHTLGGHPVWERDVDRSASSALQSRISTVSGLSEPRVRLMLLVSWERSLGGTERVQSATAPWINSLGIFHRIRKRHGLQCCPDCVAADGVYRRTWRLSFVTVCVRHRRQLVDACGYCDAPLIPHRQDGGSGRCHHCNRALAATWREDNSSLEPTRLQCSLVDAMTSDRPVATPIGGISLGDLVRGIRLLQRHRLLPLRAGTTSSRGATLEHARVDVRREKFAVLEQLVSGLPDSLGGLVSNGSMSADYFRTLSPPHWLDSMEAHLSPRPAVSRHRKPRLTISAQLNLLRTKRPSDWRSQRASLIVAAALKR